MSCTNCGQKITQSDLSCTNCGQKITQSDFSSNFIFHTQVQCIMCVLVHIGTIYIIHDQIQITSSLQYTCYLKLEFHETLVCTTGKHRALSGEVACNVRLYLEIGWTSVKANLKH